MVGDSVVATARKPEQLDDLRQRWGNRILPVQLDVTESSASRRAVGEALNAYGRIDVVVNNAGKADFAAIEDCTEESFRSQLETVFMGVVHVTKAALPVLRQQGSGHFIQISSAGDRLGTPGLAAYQSSKWAMMGFSTTLTAEVAHLDVKVTTLEPGTMRTDMPGGSSMEMSEVSAAYRSTVGAVADRIRGSYLDAPNDPAKVAQLIIDLTNMDSPPERLLVGTDAFEYGEATVKALAVNDKRWKDLSLSVNAS